MFSACRRRRALATTIQLGGRRRAPPAFWMELGAASSVRRRRAGLDRSSPRRAAIARRSGACQCHPGLAFTINGSTFHTDLFVMPLAGFDVVLGTRWLGTLGPIVWDFASASMAFSKGERAAGRAWPRPRQRVRPSPRRWGALDEAPNAHMRRLRRTRASTPWRDHAMILKRSLRGGPSVPLPGA